MDGDGDDGDGWRIGQSGEVAKQTRVRPKGSYSQQTCHQKERLWIGTASVASNEDIEGWRGWSAELSTKSFYENGFLPNWEQRLRRLSLLWRQLIA